MYPLDKREKEAQKGASAWPLPLFKRGNMQTDHLKTPYKLNRPVIAPSGRPGAFDCYAVDSPFPFRHNGKFYMTYIGYDGIGYQTGLAVSDDLLHWQPQGVLLKRASNREWDSVGMAASCILMDGNDLFGMPQPKKIDGKYWLVYHSYPESGYENGSASQGLAYTEDEDLQHWYFLDKPIFTNDTSQRWESGGLYKSFIFEHDRRFYMFYNAKDKRDPWHEQIGLAFSDDMLHWRRYEKNPVLRVSSGAWDSRFVSDPAVWYDSIGKQWVMFYYGYGGNAAMEGLAVSHDLLHWEKFPVPIVSAGKEGDIDAIHAHKPGIIVEKGVLYHFYCASRPRRETDRAVFGDEYRCISVARSIPW